MPWSEEDKGAEPKERPLGFQEIARCLTSGGSPEGQMDSPETSVALVPLVEPAVATVVSTTVGQDQIKGSVYVSTITASIEFMKLEAPSAVGHQGGTIVDLIEEDLVEGQP